MRKVKIDDKRTLPAIWCPIQPKECNTRCAWFRIKEEPAVHYKQSIAYCGDKLIGKIIYD